MVWSGYIILFFFQAEDGIRDLVRSRGLGDVYKRKSRSRADSLCAGPRLSGARLVGGRIVARRSRAPREGLAAVGASPRPKTSGAKTGLNDRHLSGRKLALTVRPMPLPTKGVIAALWTPIDRSGNLLSTELAAHVRFLRQHGIHGMMVLGSTGGFPLLSVEQRKEVLAVARSHAPDLPSMANISDTRPEVVADLGRFARALGRFGGRGVPIPGDHVRPAGSRL